ncbi:Chorion peroxidase [Acromyrmex echinatior]|uniref:Chorion peroxidase n=1 Tax=Acromyrmex echinatior TaxID=103372 RepID=F4WSW7_ACREC|nr:Chorion peroxidase [Acromyrmex echinatior]
MKLLVSLGQQSLDFYYCVTSEHFRHKILIKVIERLVIKMASLYQRNLVSLGAALLCLDQIVKRVFDSQNMVRNYKCKTDLIDKDKMSKAVLALYHPECLPIAVNLRDNFYGPLGVRCLEFLRSGPAPKEGCEFGPREQLSQVTSYLDASMVYSSNAMHSDSLRIFRNVTLFFRPPI